ncbi:MAG: hydrolase 1, exosortase A system-associated [Methylococcaceae bacterium]|nr:hydrolase 1, exosortase A system-associated [Methylococcaceae bacterium]
MNKEIPIVFQCHEVNLLGIIHTSANASTLGVLLVVGGPQYRVGSHRQFVLLARMLADNHIPVMRFDYRGMGDAEGEQMSFDTVDDDIAAAINAFYQVSPDLSGIVIWGLCDAASAALFYAYQDERVRGLVLLNPWVYTEQSAATVYLKHYYLQRLLNPDFWRKLFSLKFDYLQSVASLLTLVKKTINRTPKADLDATTENGFQIVSASLSLPVRMRECLRRFKHPILLILSGRDLTADEFRAAIAGDRQWQSLLSDVRVTRHDFMASDHTFSSKVWRDQVADWTLCWLNELTMRPGTREEA